jgi:hypothetical protein
MTVTGRDARRVVIVGGVQPTPPRRRAPEDQGLSGAAAPVDDRGDGLFDRGRP